MIAHLLLAHAAAAGAIQISVGTEPLFALPPTYVSYNLDPSCNRGFHKTNFTNPNLKALASFLAPARLRFGGSGANALVYSFAPGEPDCAAVPAPPPLAPGCDFGTAGCLNASHFTALLDLAAAAQADVIMGVSYDTGAACKGAPWDTSNFARLLDFFNASGRPLWGLEMGNEVNLAQCVAPGQLAAAADTMAALLAASAVPAARVIGPDTGSLYDPVTWAGEFAGNVTPGVLAAVTHHAYLGLQRAAFASPAALAVALDGLVPDMAAFAAMVRARGAGAETHAGEMGPHGGGDDGSCGANSTCGVFASAIWYADDLGARAAHGYTQHNRQTLFGGHYGLLSSVDGVMALGPDDAVSLTPDYWAAWLFKRTLGPQVLAAASSDASVRAYAFRGPPPSPFAARARCAPAGAQLLLLNLAPAPAAAALPAAAPGAAFAAWSLTGAGGDVFSGAAELNGAPLPSTLDVRTGGAPAAALGFISVPPVEGLARDGVTLPALSITFLCMGA